MASDAVRSDNRVSTTDCDTSLDQAVVQSDKEEIPSGHLGSKTDLTDTIQPGSSRTVKRHRRTVCNLPASSVHSVNLCLPKVASAAAERCSVIRKYTEEVKTAILKQHIPTRISKKFEPDVLLTPLSEERMTSLMRARHLPVANTNSFLSVASLECSGLTPEASAISRSCALDRPPHHSENNIVDEDVAESAMPMLAELNTTCSLISLQHLAQKNGFVNDNTEIDVFLRSFCVEESDVESPEIISPDVYHDNQQGSDGCRIGSKSMNKSKGAASIQRSKAKKHNVAVTTKTTRNEQSALKIVASGNHKDSKRCHVESNYGKLSGRNKKGTKTDRSSVYQSFAMTLRPRKKPKGDDVGRRASFNCKRRTHGQQTKTSTSASKDKRHSSRIQRKKNSTSKQLSQQVCTKVASVARNRGRGYSKSTSPHLQSSSRACNLQAARKSSRSHSKSTSPPLLSSGGSDRQYQTSGQSGTKSRSNQKRSKSSRKRIGSDISTRLPSKKQKLSTKATCTHSPKSLGGKADGNLAVRRSRRLSELRHSRRSSADCACSVSVKQSKTRCGMGVRKTCSSKQSVSKRVSSANQKTAVRKVTSAKLTEDRENVNTVTTQALPSNKAKSAAGAVLSLLKGKKKRSVDIFQCVFLIHSVV